MPPLSKESIDSDEEIMDIPGPHHPTPFILDPKTTPPIMDLVGFWSYFLMSGTNYLFRPFLVLWRLMEVSLLSILSLALLTWSFLDVTTLQVAGMVATVTPFQQLLFMPNWCISPTLLFQAWISTQLPSKRLSLPLASNN